MGLINACLRFQWPSAAWIGAMAVNRRLHRAGAGRAHDGGGLNPNDFVLLRMWQE